MASTSDSSSPSPTHLRSVAVDDDGDGDGDGRSGARSWLPCLQSFVDSAVKEFDEQIDVYVSWSLHYELRDVMAFFDLLSSQASALSSLADVPFTPGSLSP